KTTTISFQTHINEGKQENLSDSAGPQPVRTSVSEIARHLMPPQVDLNEIWQSWDQWSFLSEETFYMGDLS
ncbi:hypothetical protein F7725_009933, partial [Dissostichus mawsoni]